MAEPRPDLRLQARRLALALADIENLDGIALGLEENVVHHGVPLMLRDRSGAFVRVGLEGGVLVASRGVGEAPFANEDGAVVVRRAKQATPAGQAEKEPVRTFRLDEDNFARVRSRANRDGVTVSDLIRRAVLAYLETR